MHGVIIVMAVTMVGWIGIDVAIDRLRAAARVPPDNTPIEPS